MIQAWTAEQIAAWCRLDDARGLEFVINIRATGRFWHAWAEARMAFRDALVRLAPEAPDYQDLEDRVFAALGASQRFPDNEPPSPAHAAALATEGLRRLWATALHAS